MLLLLVGVPRLPRLRIMALVAVVVQDLPLILLVAAVPDLPLLLVAVVLDLPLILVAAVPDLPLLLVAVVVMDLLLVVPDMAWLHRVPIL